MRTYQATFYRIVTDVAGHDHRVVQNTVMVRASSEVSAAWQAKALLCSRAGVVDWRLRADACHVAPVTDLAA